MLLFQPIRSSKSSSPRIASSLRRLRSRDPRGVGAALRQHQRNRIGLTSPRSRRICRAWRRSCSVRANCFIHRALRSSSTGLVGSRIGRVVTKDRRGSGQYLSHPHRAVGALLGQSDTDGGVPRIAPASLQAPPIAITCQKVASARQPNRRQCLFSFERAAGFIPHKIRPLRSAGGAPTLRKRDKRPSHPVVVRCIEVPRV